MVISKRIPPDSGVFVVSRTIGYDFKDTFVKCQGIEIAARLCTVENIYNPSTEKVRIYEDAEGIHLRSDELSFGGGQVQCEGNLAIDIRPYHDTMMGVTVRGSRPGELCKSVLVLIKGIEVKSFECDSINIGKHVFYEKYGIPPLIYPSRTPLMPLIFVQDDGREWFILSKDSKVRKKGFTAYYDYPLARKIIDICHEEDRRHWTDSIEAPEWKIGKIGPQCSRRDVVLERCVDLETNFGLNPYRGRKQVSWLDEIKLVVNFHGEHFTGHVFNTFDEMTERLKWVCRYMAGRHVLAFLPAWDGRYYYSYPEHEPSIRMGGEEGLRRFVTAAHVLGAKVVLMLGGPNLASFEFMDKHGFRLEDMAMKNEWGFPFIKDYLDWNSDMSKECRGVIANFGHPGFRQYMVESSCRLIKEFDVDGIFLDGAIRWLNSPDYSNYEGIKSWAEEMNRRHPDRLLMAEDGYDALWGLFGLFATGEGPLGLENAFLRYARMTHYLAYPAENGSGGVHECAWYWRDADKAQAEYTIPTISLMDGIIEQYGDELKEKIGRYRQWTMKD